MTIDGYRLVTNQGRWADYALAILNKPSIAPCEVDDFGTYWIEGGHKIREQIADDRLLVSLLRKTLAPYDDGPVTLFRGENKGRWENGSIGLAWTANQKTASMFARGLNAVVTGGVLLKARFEPVAIISGPNRHSRYLDENQFTIDPFFDTEITVVDQFPRVD